MTKVGIISDLHTEGWSLEAMDIFLPRIRETLRDAEIVILAGDIAEGTAAIHVAARLFDDRPVVVLAGNHEYYHGEYHEVAIGLGLKSMEFHNVHVLDIAFGGKIVLEDLSIRIIGGTLWTDFKINGNEVMSKIKAQQALKDFSVIEFFDAAKNETRNLWPDDTANFHKEERELIVRELEKPFEGKTIVATHHCGVTYGSSDPDRHLAAAFCSNLDQLLIRPDVDLLVWGHTHEAFDGTPVPPTKMINAPFRPPVVDREGNETSGGSYGLVVEI